MLGAGVGDAMPPSGIDGAVFCDSAGDVIVLAADESCELLGWSFFFLKKSNKPM